MIAAPEKADQDAPPLLEYCHWSGEVNELAIGTAKKMDAPLDHAMYGLELSLAHCKGITPPPRPTALPTENALRLALIMLLERVCQ